MTVLYRAAILPLSGAIRKFWANLAGDVRFRVSFHRQFDRRIKGIDDPERTHTPHKKGPEVPPTKCLSQIVLIVATGIRNGFCRSRLLLSSDMGYLAITMV